MKDEIVFFFVFFFLLMTLNSKTTQQIENPTKISKSLAKPCTNIIKHTHTQVMNTSMSGWPAQTKSF